METIKLKISFLYALIIVICQLQSTTAQTTGTTISGIPSTTSITTASTDTSTTSAATTSESTSVTSATTASTTSSITSVTTTSTATLTISATITSMITSTTSATTALMTTTTTIVSSTSATSVTTALTTTSTNSGTITSDNTFVTSVATTSTTTPNSSSTTTSTATSFTNDTTAFAAITSLTTISAISTTSATTTYATTSSASATTTYATTSSASATTASTVISIISATTTSVTTFTTTVATTSPITSIISGTASFESAFTSGATTPVATTSTTSVTTMFMTSATTALPITSIISGTATFESALTSGATTPVVTASTTSVTTMFMTSATTASPITSIISGTATFESVFTSGATTSVPTTSTTSVTTTFMTSATTASPITSIISGTATFESAFTSGATTSVATTSTSSVTTMFMTSATTALPITSIISGTATFESALTSGATTPVVTASTTSVTTMFMTSATTASPITSIISGTATFESVFTSGATTSVPTTSTTSVTTTFMTSATTASPITSIISGTASFESAFTSGATTSVATTSTSSVTTMFMTSATTASPITSIIGGTATFESAFTSGATTPVVTTGTTSVTTMFMISATTASPITSIISGTATFESAFTSGATTSVPTTSTTSVTTMFMTSATTASPITSIISGTASFESALTSGATTPVVTTGSTSVTTMFMTSATTASPITSIISGTATFESTFTTNPMTLSVTTAITGITTISATLSTISIATASMITAAATSVTTSTTSIATTASPYTPTTCNNASLVPLQNGTCVSNSAGQKDAVDTINNNSSSSEMKANALLLYIQALTNQNGSSTTNGTLPLSQIDDVVRNLNYTIVSVNTTSSFLMVQPVNVSSNTNIVGAIFQRNSGGAVVPNTNRTTLLGNRNVSVAAIFSAGSLIGATFLNMFIIDRPDTYRNIDNSSNKSLASSLVIASVRGNGSPINAINISLSFKVLPEFSVPANATFLCSFYDTNNLRWSESGCSSAVFNTANDRYECSCNHTTSFALIWLPASVPGLTGTTAQNPTTEQTTFAPFTSEVTSASTLSPTSVTITSASMSSMIASTEGETTFQSPTTAQSTILTTTSTSTSSSTSTTTAPTCNYTLPILLPNDTCVSNIQGQEIAANTLNSNTTNSTALANALGIFVETTNNLNQTFNFPVSINTIDDVVRRINATNITISRNSSFFMAQAVNQSGSVLVLGASFTRGGGGSVINNGNQGTSINSGLSAAAFINNQSLAGVTALNMFIVDLPTIYQKIDNSSNKSLASSVIVASVQRNSNVSTPINISLYFTLFSEYSVPDNATFLCSFYDTNNLHWSESGCSSAVFNTALDRYECSCNHLTSFALIWLPASATLGSSGQTLRAADIASLVFQSVSIVCFLAIIIHALTIRCVNPLMRLQPNDLLPLISFASTTILFIFYIALSMTVYTRTSSTDQTECFLSSHVLMFFVYFFLIFMFCAKTSVGYFNYLRFVYLFPQPSFNRLFISLFVSFFISIGWTSFAAGFDSNSSFHITKLYPYQLCWFTRDVLYYFLTIPVCTFLLLNLIIIIFVVKHIISHTHNATSPHQSYERMKRCVLVLLSSCVTQGVGWLFGPFISFVNPTAGQVLEWFFIVFNGLEGLWSILLYIIIRSQRIDEQKRVTAVKELTKTSSIAGEKYRRAKDRTRRSSVRTGDIEIVQRNVRREATPVFDDLNESRTINWPVNEDDSSSL